MDECTWAWQPPKQTRTAIRRGDKLFREYMQSFSTNVKNPRERVVACEAERSRRRDSLNQGVTSWYASVPTQIFFFQWP